MPCLFLWVTCAVLHHLPSRLRPLVSVVSVCTVNQTHVAEAQSVVPAALWQEFIQSVHLGKDSYFGLWSYLQCDSRIIATPKLSSDTV